MATTLPSSDATGAPVSTGAHVLVETGLGILAGKRVGLVLNHTATVNGAPLADVLATAGNVKVVALFVPEHGIKGTKEAGELFGDDRDRRADIPIFSLYGATRKPTREMLANVDILLFDMQDIGVRFYTFISTMGLIMQAAAEANIPLVVLDRPNPLGGEYVSGFVTDQREISFVGQYRIPAVHGLTIGELAQLIKGQSLLSGLQNLQLSVIPMQGWQRWMRWPDTQLSWTRTSPNIVDFETAMVYAGIGLFEATSISDGRGTTTPFTVVGAPWVDGAQLARDLNGLGLPGVKFEPVRYRPRSIPGMASKPTLEGQTVHGVRITVVDHRDYLPMETGIHVLHAFNRHAQSRNQPSIVSKVGWLDKLAGTHRLYEMLADGVPAQKIIEAWKTEAASFGAMRKRYLLY